MKNEETLDYRSAIFYALARMFERASYYGLRGILILFMIGETLQMERKEALAIYGTISGTLLFAQIVGGLIGDLVTGNKKAVIIGALIQAIGTFTLCLPVANSLYIGLICIVIGSGLYTPNLIANYGKLFLSKKKLIDSGFSWLYVAINIGSFFGIFLIGLIGEKYGFKFGFLVSGILIILSLVLILLTKGDRKSVEYIIDFNKIKIIFSIIAAILATGVFWGVYELSGGVFYSLADAFKNIDGLPIPNDLWLSANTYFLIPIGIILSVLWSYKYSTQLFKLVFGVVFSILAIVILYLIPELPEAKHAALYFAVILFLVIAEIHIAPMLHALLINYSNPKYLAIIIALSYFPVRMMIAGIGYANIEFTDTNLILNSSLILLVFTTMILTGVLIWNKKSINN